ncbi:MAG: bifunctional UDP-N-acetylglucosamine diphosphorylase/glucosamine-1-phosphate N-acetyltransferase GlmU [Berryella intestinalis]|uniref:bifunctional UDP-N-acetylglucosamine diphosphorylase/glucosamine-1-phosphate N-acetyltransferase GlmU n=1 Tax=Berryella intestinalis TaxID=1531429 RepID=UPI002A5069D1|nr:bifunctional UDP-N-acetylglucosamine diphosphorylase/glucosamine-1-phosphate N-acetyltransferase GlmU [Berryella intestinalis]MDD7369918.1 bifunctional UDP-N-acetylglucosamine diphosphorylase/glucosamine-1-phosphate N-acetyltransferase GlmU [Berryella intestinalis]MDY3129842.1 bifunctional UDP-N-acetylglucosamine diphosphorylase/glucosamine-1-phosphate N-acetyltransferase GlmU [Berryella intestinalis]
MEAAAIVLAAGAGTRMKSKKPKVAHEVLGKPLVRWVVDEARAAGANRIVSVVGHLREQVIPLVEDCTEIVVQEQRLGTADAVASGREALSGFDGSLLVLSGDCPLITAETLSNLVAAREADNAAVALLTMKLADPFGYGRIVHDEAGRVCGIVEQKDATEAQRRIDSCNSGFYCFDSAWLFEALTRIDDNNAQGEFYLTDVVRLAYREGRGVVEVVTPDPQECLGVNSRVQLAEAVKVAQRRINRRHLDNGVTMIDPDQVWIGPDVRIASDVELYPQVFLMGNTVVGEDSVIGPNSRLTDTVVGAGCVVDETVALDARLDDGATSGPRAYLRPGAHLCEGAKAGTHVEIKKSTVGKGSKVPHLSYIGDAVIGEGVNIGAGSITCNYDGKSKHATSIGDGAFIGSDTMMVAPVSIGAGAIVGAGSTIAKDVPADALGIARAEQVSIEGWAARKRGRLEQK